MAWFAALALGRLPLAFHRFFAAYIRYVAHVIAFVSLVANPFPGFTGEPGYPLDIELDPPERQSRWTIGFRLLLAFPAFMVSAALTGALSLVAIFGWFVSLALGRMPIGLRNLGAYNDPVRRPARRLQPPRDGRYPDSGPLQRRLEDDEASSSSRVAPAS